MTLYVQEPAIESTTIADAAGVNIAAVSATGALKIDGSAATQPISGTITANAGMNLNTSLLALDTTLTGGTQKTKIIDTGGSNALSVSAAGAAKVDGSGVTQPISGTVSAAQSGTWTVQPGNTANTTAWKVDGSAVTQPISAASLPLPAGAATATGLTTLDTDLGIINANLTNGNFRGTVSTTDANLWVTATGAAAAAVTLTLPAVAAQFHRICSIEIETYSTVARVGGVTPVLVTTTNLPGSPVWTFASAAAIGSSDSKVFVFSSPIKSSVVNTATTIVCPATTSVIWRVNVSYYTAA